MWPSCASWPSTASARICAGPLTALLCRRAITACARICAGLFIARTSLFPSDGACSAVQEGQTGDGGMVYSWAQHRLCLYLGELRQHLPRISEGYVPVMLCRIHLMLFSI